jgi:hypothetical protein
LRAREWVRLLEARFHPASKAGPDVVVVGRVVCEGRRTTIQPVEIPPRAVRPFDASRLLEKLRFLVTSTGPDPFAELLKLRSDFWSFRDISPGP